MRELPGGVSGAEAVALKLRGWPSFHDAEILELQLCRNSESKMVIALADAVEPTARTRIVFTLLGVTGLSLCEFSTQNVIQNLYLEPREDELVVQLTPCYGLNGWIQAKSIRVEIGAADLDDI